VTVVQFSKKKILSNPDPAQKRFVPPGPSPVVIPGLVSMVWVIVMLTWPLLKRIASADMIVQSLRLLYYWNAPDVHSGWTFVLHLGAWVGAMCLMFSYTPQHSKNTRLRINR
jgi:hypothetical protein